MKRILLLLALILFSFKTILPFNGELYFQILNNSGNFDFDLYVSTNDFSWNWVNNSVVLDNSFFSHEVTNRWTYIYDAPNGVDAGDYPMHWGIMKFIWNIYERTSTYPYRIYRATRIFTLDLRDQGWGGTNYPSPDSHVLVDVTGGNYQFYLSQANNLAATHQLINENTLIRIWEFWGVENINQTNFRVPVVLRNSTEYSPNNNFGTLFANSHSVNSGMAEPFWVEGNLRVHHGTLEKLEADSKRYYTFKWTKSNIDKNGSTSDYHSYYDFTLPRNHTGKSVTRNFKAVHPLTIKNYLIDANGLSKGTVFFKNPTTTNQFQEISVDNGGSGYILNEAFENLSEPIGGQLNQKYSLKANANFIYNNHTYNWYRGDFNPTTATDFMVTGPTQKNAYFKGHLLSNNFTALNSQQRKMIHIAGDFFYLVYESNDKCWITSSTYGFSDQWLAEEEFSTLVSGLSPTAYYKNPSIDNTGDSIYITFEYKELNSPEAQIVVLKKCPYQSGTWQKEIIDTYSASFFGSAKPLVAAFNYGTYNPTDIVVLYKKSSSQGLYYRNYVYNGGIYNWRPVELLTGTSGASINFSIAPAKNTTDHKLHIAFEENMASIKYYCLFGFPSKQYTNPPPTISTGSPYQNNYSPSISVTGQNKIVVSWTGASGIMLGKGNETETTYEYKTVVRPYETSWGNFLVAGNNVNNTYSSSTTNTSQSQTIISWNENQNTSSKYLRRLGTYYCPTKPLSPNGIMPVVSAASNLTEARSLVLNTSTTPYALYKSTTNFNEICEMEDEGGLDKITEDGLITYGRTGLVFINGVGFIFETGDVVAGDSVIKFIERPDTVLYSTTNQLNEAVRTNTFELDQNSSLIFSNKYYTLFSEFADTALTENDNVTFKVELVNANTNTVAGTFDNVTYDKNNLDKLENIAYEVNCSGIEAGEYFLRLVTTVNGNAEYNLANVMSDASELGKKNFSTIYFDGSALPTAYEISQNYPNPFNPTTVINYQIPKDGIVTIKVYDILGKELTTLVNETKSVGRYSINFDGSNLASGIYIYRIASGDFVSTKKMMLIK